MNNKELNKKYLELTEKYNDIIRENIELKNRENNRIKIFWRTQRQAAQRKNIDPTDDRHEFDD